MLRQWMLNPDLDSIFVEEKYVQWTESLRSDRYTTVPPLIVLGSLGKSCKRANVAKTDLYHPIPGDTFPARKIVRQE